MYTMTLYIYMSCDATAHTTAVRSMDHLFRIIMQPAYCLGGAVQPDELGDSCFGEAMSCR